MSLDVMDWNVLTLPGLDNVVERAAAQVTRQYIGVVQYDDLVQEAHVALAGSGKRVRGYLGDPHQGEAYVYRWLWSRLTDVARREARVSNRQVPIEYLGTE